MGLAQPRELFPQSSSPSPPSPGPGPSSRSYEEGKAVLLKRLADTKKRLNAIPSETRNTYVAKKREKQLERFLLPDAPPRKQTREDDPACDELATTPRQQRLEAECDTPTSVLSLDSAIEVPGFSPLRVDWTTGNLRKQTPVTPATHRSQKPGPSKANLNERNKTPVKLAPSTLRTQKPGPSKENVIPNIIKKDTKSKHNKKKVITGPDYGTKRAEEIFEGWCQTLQAESDEDEEDDIGDIDDKQTPVDITCEESAILPPNLAEDVRQWLEDEDADADKTITTMLPIDHLTFDWTCDHTSFKGQREIFTATPGPTFDLDDTTTPLDIFRKIFDDHLLDLIVTQTNKHSNLLIDLTR
ncbi:uncharacterized protein isoform X3 [Choristoneura fumiferana]|uniref:uncharacterized protein isoform X3 n=1 Tax=Choristoneura fumiferana TaxID=7141 RepID=UPI003D159155